MVEQLYTVEPPKYTYWFISLLNQALPILWQPEPRRVAGQVSLGGGGGVVLPTVTVTQLESYEQPFALQALTWYSYAPAAFPYSVNVVMPVPTELITVHVPP